MALFISKILFTLDEFKRDRLALTTCPAKLKFRSLAALVAITHKTFLATTLSPGYKFVFSFHHDIKSTHPDKLTADVL